MVLIDQKQHDCVISLIELILCPNDTVCTGLRTLLNSILPGFGRLANLAIAMALERNRVRRILVGALAVSSGKTPRKKALPFRIWESQEPGTRAGT